MLQLRLEKSGSNEVGNPASYRYIGDDGGGREVIQPGSTIATYPQNAIIHLPYLGEESLSRRLAQVKAGSDATTRFKEPALFDVCNTSLFPELSVGAYDIRQSPLHVTNQPPEHLHTSWHILNLEINTRSLKVYSIRTSSTIHTAVAPPSDLVTS